MSSTLANTLSLATVTITKDVTVESHLPSPKSYIPMMKEEGYTPIATTLHKSDLFPKSRRHNFLTGIVVPNVHGAEDAFLFVRTGKAHLKERVTLPEITAPYTHMNRKLIHSALHSELTWGNLGAQVSVNEKRYKKMFKSYVTFSDIVIYGTPASIVRIKSRLVNAVEQLQ